MGAAGPNFTIEMVRITLRVTRGRPNSLSPHEGARRFGGIGAVGTARAVTVACARDNPDKRLPTGRKPGAKLSDGPAVTVDPGGF